MDGSVRRGDTGVHGDVQDGFADLFECRARPPRCTKVKVDFVVPEGGEDRDGDERARAAVQAFARPEAAPRDFGDESLEVGVGARRRRDRTVDMLVAENLAPDPHAALISIHRPTAFLRVR